MTSAVLLALIPIVILIGLGMVLRNRRLVDEKFWPQCEKLAYFVLLPCLFFHGLATAQLKDLPVSRLATVIIVTTVIVAGCALTLRPLIKSGPAFTSVFQGSVRFNNYVGVTLAVGLFGEQGIALAAICNASIVPTVNVLCVLVFAWFGTAKLSGLSILKQLVTNPLLLSSVGGIIFQFFGLTIPPGIEPAIRVLGAASLPMGLLCIGAALEFLTARRWIWPIAVSSVLKFLVMPAVTVFFALVLGLEGPVLTTAILFQTLPTASSSYIMARQLGGDAPLMAGIAAAQTVLAMVMIPVVLIVLANWLPLHSLAK